MPLAFTQEDLLFVLLLTFKIHLATFAEMTGKPQMAFLLGESVFSFSMQIH